MELENTSARAASKEHVAHQEHDHKGRHITHGATADIEPTLGWRTWVVYAGQSLARKVWDLELIVSLLLDVFRHQLVRGLFLCLQCSPGSAVSACGFWLACQWQPVRDRRADW